jgi:hypothetical protein
MNTTTTKNSRFDLFNLQEKEVILVCNNLVNCPVFTGKLFRDIDGSYQVSESNYFHPLHVKVIIDNIIILS